MYGAVVVLLWSSHDFRFKINIWSAGQPFTYLFSFIVSFIKTKPNLMTSTFHNGKQNLGSNDWINTLLPTGCTCSRLFSRINATGPSTADSSLQTRTVSGYNHRQTLQSDLCFLCSVHDGAQVLHVQHWGRVLFFLQARFLITARLHEIPLEFVDSWIKQKCSLSASFHNWVRAALCNTPIQNAHFIFDWPVAWWFTTIPFKPPPTWVQSGGGGGQWVDKSRWPAACHSNHS